MQTAQKESKQNNTQSHPEPRKPSLALCYLTSVLNPNFLSNVGPRVKQCALENERQGPDMFSLNITVSLERAVMCAGNRWYNKMVQQCHKNHRPPLHLPPFPTIKPKATNENKCGTFLGDK